ncbi:MAG: hypothetical protein NTW21_14850 [Verrucomicrobia bacterium]|nr:hypothetical protein [Verrucomicrobiota bacterium]
MYFNPHGASLEWALALARQGFETDIVHYEDGLFEPRGDYQLVVAHVGSAVSRLLQLQAREVPIIRYATTAHWQWFEEQTASRYQALAVRRGLPHLPSPTRVLRSEDEQTLDGRASLVVGLGRMTTRKYTEAGLSAVCINNAAYITPAAAEAIRKPMGSGKGFLYQGGIACVQKGLDLLIEAFAQERDLHLYLDTPLEPDVLAAYRSELALPNIHFVRPSLRFAAVRRRVAAACPFLIYAGLNSGQSTALVAGTALGRVPVVTETADLPWEDGLVRIGSPTVEGVREAIRRAAAMPLTERHALALAARDGFMRFFTPRAFAESVDGVLRTVLRQ